MPPRPAGRPLLLPEPAAGATPALRPNAGHVRVVGPARADQVAAAQLLLDAAELGAPLALAADDPAAALPELHAEPGLVFFSSGTTGTPRPHRRSWAELEAESSPHGSPDDRYLLAYNLARYAGLQVLFHCRRHGSALIVPASLRDGASLVAAGAEHGATHLSATPSLLKQLVLLGAPARLPGLRQITLGGEHASQAALDLARRCWPGARVTAIYASSEGGACFTASDGLEGFPLSVLERGRDGRRGELDEDGQLVLALPGGRVVATGDFFERTAGRLLFRGRGEDLINVGGFKVSPVKVERVILGVPGVEECLVRGRENAVLGQVVEAEIVGAVEPASVRAACKAALERPEVPVSIRLVERLELSPAQKLVRGRAA